MIQNVPIQKKQRNSLQESGVEKQGKMQHSAVEDKKENKREISLQGKNGVQENKNQGSKILQNKPDDQDSPIHSNKIKQYFKSQTKQPSKYKDISTQHPFKVPQKSENQVIKDKLLPSYEQVLRKYKQLGGKPKSKSKPYINDASSILNAKSISTSPNDIEANGKEKLTKLKEKINQSAVKKATSYNFNNQTILEKSTPNKDSGIRKTTQVDKSKTRIRFLAEKDHEASEIMTDVGDKNKNLLQTHLKSSPLTFVNQQYMRKSSSVPTILTSSQLIKSSRAIGKEKGESRLKSSSLNKNKVFQTDQYLQNRSQLRLQKTQQLSNIQFSLTNLKERISQIKNKNHPNVTMSRITTTNDLDTKYTQNKTKNIFDISTIPVSLNRYKKVGENKESRVTKKGKDDSQMESLLNFTEEIAKIENSRLSQKEVIQSSAKNTNNAQILNSYQASQNKGINKLVKLTKQKQHLEQIVEDFENENNEKQQQLRKHRNQNKNIQINLLAKRQKITQLQAQLNNYKDSDDEDVFHHKETNANSIQNRQNSIAISPKQEVLRLREEKKQKQKLYTLEKNTLKEEIQKIQIQMKQQQKKFKQLKEQENEIKNAEMEKKEQQLETKNKQLTLELENKTKELEIILQKQQQKANLYEQELRQQKQRNEEITAQLRKQQAIQELLVKQLEKLARERQAKKEKKEEEKNKERIKLMQQIRQLQETENKILLEYQRDTQAISSMFEAMRLKNIELETKIKERKKQKQMQKKTQSEAEVRINS